MADKTKTTKKVNWSKAQILGFWSLVIILAAFWGGVTVGTQATLASQAREEQVKTQAIEAYKAELLKEEQQTSRLNLLRLLRR